MTGRAAPEGDAGPRGDAEAAGGGAAGVVRRVPFDSLRSLRDRGRRNTPPTPSVAVDMTVPALSLLDLVPVRTGQTSAQAVAASLALARCADGLGLRRLWYAEHHNMPSVASTSPPVLAAAAAVATERILLGAGDGRHLALLGLINLVVVLPALWLVAGMPLDAVAAVVAIQAVFQILFMAVRFVFLGLRVRGTRWMRLA